MVRRGVAPDLLTDQTSAHDPLNGYIPPATQSTMPQNCVHLTQTNISSDLSIPLPSTCAPCWTCSAVEQ